MTTEDLDREDVEPAAVPTAAKPGKRKRLILASAAVVLLAAGGAGAFFVLGGPTPATEGHEGAAAPPAEDHAAEPPIYVDVPAMVVNLRGLGGQPGYLKLHFVIVAADAEKGAEITARLPSILDALQPFLRELRPEDLAGSAAVYRLKEEMLARTATQVSAGAARDVLIQDLIQQ